jgi:hypothetical protein
VLGLFGGKDWNVVGIIFERPDLYRVNANRGKGGQATTIRDAVKGHDRTIVWAVFDQKGGLLECHPGPGAKHVPASVVTQLTREIGTNATVREVLLPLEKGKETKLSKPLVWQGYPPKPEHRS